MMKSRSLLHSFGYAIEGIDYTLRTQRNAKIHVAVAAAVIAVGLWLGIPLAEWGVLFLTMGAVFSAEMLNTVVETIIDAQIEEFHPLAKIAKDVAAGAVLVMSIIAVVVGICILGPPLWHKLAPMLGTIWSRFTTG